MRKIPNIIRIGTIVCIAWFAAAALTPLTSVAIRNSTMDSTAIGGTAPSSAKFTTAQVASPAAAVPTQGGYFGWNGQVLGETDFVNRQGSGIGGFSWFNTNSSSPGSSIMQLSAGGTLSGTTSLFSQAGAQAPYAAGSAVNGGWIGWGQTSTGGPNLGEMDFIAETASGSGGFNWYSTNSPSSAGSAIARMDAAGNLSLRSVSASAGFTGNAATATALTANPSNCAAGQYSTGIQANGTADCTNLPNIQTGTGSNCTTGSNSYDICNSVVAWTAGFADTAYQMTCTMIGPSNPRAYIVGVSSKTTNGANVTIATGGTVSITFTRLECIAMRN